MNYVLQTLVSVRFLAAFCSGVAVDIASLIFRTGFPGVARRQPTFFASPKKVGKERRPQVRRPFGVPCAARKRGPLRNSWLENASVQKVAIVLATQTVLADDPRVCSAARRLSWGPGRIATGIAFPVVPAQAGTHWR